MARLLSSRLVVAFGVFCLVVVAAAEINTGGEAGYVMMVDDGHMADDRASTDSPEHDGKHGVTAKMVNVKTANRQRLLDHLTNAAHRQQNSDYLPTHVMVKFIPIKIQDLNEKIEVLETTVRFQLSWQDRRLSWQPEKYNNITECIVPGSSIWSPDVAILNSVSDIYHVVRDTRFEMKVESTGRVWWHPTGIVKTYCKLNLRYFPFDKQKCKLVLESPTLDIRFMNLTLRSTSEPVSTVMYISGETWDLLNVTGYNVVKRLGSKTVFARVEFVVYLQRAKIYHLLNVIFPAIFLSLVQVMFFLLPATHPQRVGSSTTTLLSVVVFHSVAASQLPKTSTDLPLLAFYIFMVTFISGLSVITSICVAKFAFYASQNRALPNWLKGIRRPAVLLRRLFGRNNKKRRQDDDNEVQKLPDGAENHHLHVMVPLSGDSAVSSSGDSESQQKQKRDEEAAFRNWNDVSKVVDFCLFSIAISMAVLSPFILFVLIPSVVADQ